MNGFAVAQEYIDVETAKQTGRAAFGEMVAYLKAHPSVRVMLVEKTDATRSDGCSWRYLCIPAVRSDCKIPPFRDGEDGAF